MPVGAPDEKGAIDTAKWGSGVMARFEVATRDMTEYPALGGGSDALFELGLMYCSGREVDVDLVTAHKWFNLAASRGNVEARRYRLEIARRDDESRDRGSAKAGPRVAREALTGLSSL